MREGEGYKKKKRKKKKKKRKQREKGVVEGREVKCAVHSGSVQFCSFCAVWRRFEIQPKHLSASCWSAWVSTSHLIWMWCEIHCDALVRCCEIQRNPVEFSTLQLTAVHAVIFRIMFWDSVQCIKVRFSLSAVQCTVKCSEIKSSLFKYSVAHYSAVQ